MAHGTDHAIAGLGDGSTIGAPNAADADNRLSSLAGIFDIEASEVDVADAGGYTATTDLESALQEIYSRLPYTIEQSIDLIIDTTVGDGSTLRDTSLVAPVLASTKYAVEAVLFVTSTTNSGWKFGFTAPSGATLGWAFSAIEADDVVDQDGEQGVGDSHSGATALSFSEVRMTGLLTVDTTAGNLTVQAAQASDHADDTVVHLESFLRVTKVA